MSKPFEKEVYFAMAIDPVHIGTGGYRLGRGDMSIVRDVSTEIPKIPATSLTGPARAYTAMQTNKYRWKEEDTEYSCTGRGGEGGENHCGEPAPACPVCIPYGFSKGNYSMQGLAQFFDAHIVFFPVATVIGPLWVTSPMMLDFIENENFEIGDERFYPLADEIKNKRLNFGWLMLEKDYQGKGSLKNAKDIPVRSLPPAYLANRIVLVSDKNISRIINSNLEVRTSVSIDPATGAAEDGALFTYEAIPRGTILRFEVVYNNPGNFRVNNQEIMINNHNSSGLIPATIDWVKKQVESSFQFFKDLGIGGMNTRGMGRLKIFNPDREGDK